MGVVKDMEAAEGGLKTTRWGRSGARVWSPRLLSLLVKKAPGKKVLLTQPLTCSSPAASGLGLLSRGIC